MDPLSISMAIITTISATKSAISAARSVYRAPEELESLQNDLCDAELMIRDIKAYTEEDGRALSPQETALQEQLTAAEGIVVQLRSLVFNVLENPDDPTSSVRRIAWLKAKKKSRKLRKKLAQIHEDLPRRHGQVEGARITLGLRNISSVQLEMSAGLLRLEDQIDTTSQSVFQLKEALVSTQDLQDQTVSSVEDLRQDTSQRLESLESMISSSNDLLQRLPEILNLQIETSQQISTLTNSTRSAIGTTGAQTSETTTNTITSTIQSTYQSIKIQSQYQNPTSCDLSCHCRCHFPQRVDSPHFLSYLLGQIFIGYKGIPALAKRCTDERCKRDSQPKVYLTYFFPHWWIIDRMVMLLAQWTTARGPELLLRFPRRVSENSAVFQLAENGKTEDLKLLFNTGKASPNDVNDRNENALYFAWGTGRFNTVKFLMQAGADSQFETSEGRNFEDSACKMVFTKARRLEWRQWATETFINRRNQHFGFSSLHEIILELRYTPLEEEISRVSTCLGAINAQDIWGYSPLHWASVRGNLDAVSKLLASGADPNISTKYKQTPLHVSATYGKLDCATKLLDHGADPWLYDSLGWNALHFVCSYNLYQPSKPRLVEFLDKLFCMGVDINIPLNSGDTSLHQALRAPEVGSNIPLKWLLDHGADHRLISSSGHTILHQAGESGDLESVQILRNAHLSDIDIHARLCDTGTTAMDELLSPYREFPASEELIESFKLLLAEIEARTNGQPLPTHGDHMEEGDVVLSYSTPPMPGGFPTLSDNWEDDTVLPSTTPFMPKEPSISAQPSRTLDESDSEGDHVFQDSVEHQVAATT